MAGESNQPEREQEKMEETQKQGAGNAEEKSEEGWEEEKQQGEELVDKAIGKAKNKLKDQ